MTAFTDPAEYARWLATQTPPLTDEQIEAAARITAMDVAEAAA